jgi:hypothetical protein
MSKFRKKFVVVVGNVNKFRIAIYKHGAVRWHHSNYDGEVRGETVKIPHDVVPTSTAFCCCDQQSQLKASHTRTIGYNHSDAYKPTTLSSRPDSGTRNALPVPMHGSACTILWNLISTDFNHDFFVLTLKTTAD